MVSNDVRQQPMSSLAFSVAVGDALPSLSRFARRLTRDEVAGDDLVQDALTRAWAARIQFQVGTNFRAWLFQIARNRFLSLTRQAWRHVEWDPTKHERLLTDSGGQEAAVHARDIRRALERMPSHHREAIRLIYEEQLTNEQAAAVLGIHPGAMRTRAQRARQALWQSFETGRGGSIRKAARLSTTDQAGQRRSPAEVVPATNGATGRQIYERWKAAGSGVIG